MKSTQSYLCNQKLPFWEGFVMNNLLVRNFFLFFYLFTFLPLFSQRNEIFNGRILSLTVLADDDWESLPVVELGGSVDIAFDDMTHEYHRYAYKIEPCNADWTVNNELFDSDFIRDFSSDNIIDDVQESLLTTKNYTHYKFTVSGIRLSGNYKVTVYDNNADDRPVLTACFMVVEPKETSMGVSLRVTTNTDASINQKHQQVSMEVNYSGYKVTQPDQQIKTVVLQNGQWHDARVNLKPQYVMGDGLRWDHNRGLIFDAGNEYHKFEVLQTDVASMGVDHISWDSVQYHAFPYINVPRPHYIYDEDADGAYLLRNSDNVNSETESDYVLVHFQMQCPEVTNGDVYVNGFFTNDRFLPFYKMTYDHERKLYEAVVLMKFGYYNYQYLVMSPDGKVSRLPYEGNFYQTENRYQALVYYREPGGRYDRLVGYNDYKFTVQ